MALRVGQYLLNAKADLQRIHNHTTHLPQIFPLVLYNGKERWSAPARLSELEERVVNLGDYGIEVHYLPIIENQYSLDRLLQDVNLVSWLFLAEAHYDRQRAIAQLLALYERGDPQAVSALANWFQQMTLHKRIPAEDYARLQYEYRSKEELQTMIVEAILKEEEQIRQESKAEGKQEGKLAAQRETLLHLLAWRYPPLAPVDKERYTAQLDQLTDLESMMELVNLILADVPQAEFDHKLRSLLPDEPAQATANGQS